MKALLLLAFSQALWANTLIETQTAVGIANTLQGTAQVNPQEVLNQVKENVDNYEQAQEQKVSAIQAPSPSAQPVMPLPQEDSQNRIPQSEPVMPLPQEDSQNRIPQSEPVMPLPQEDSQNRIPQSEPSYENIPLEQASLLEQEKEKIQELNQSPDSMNELSHTDISNPPNPQADTHYHQDLNEMDERILPKEEYFQPDRIIEVEDKPIDYKTGTQIFYKKDCLASKSDCKRSGAVFTNIKSVIFNYAHSRGSFSKNKESK